MKKNTQWSHLGYSERKKIYEGEDKYFKANPNVTGMAAEDGKVIMNPYSTLTAPERNAVKKNEAFRLKLRDSNVNLDFNVTPEQKEFFGGTEYSSNENAMRETILARIYSGDPSAKATQEQKNILQQILKGFKK